MAAEQEPGYGELLLEELGLEEAEALWTDEDETDYTGWYCVATDPFPCPAPECVFVAEFMTAAHLILVWEERDDPNLLRHAERAKAVGAPVPTWRRAARRGRRVAGRVKRRLQR